MWQRERLRIRGSGGKNAAARSGAIRVDTGQLGAYSFGRHPPLPLLPRLKCRHCCTLLLSGMDLVDSGCAAHDKLHVFNSGKNVLAFQSLPPAWPYLLGTRNPASFLPSVASSFLSGPSSPVFSSPDGKRSWEFS